MSVTRLCPFIVRMEPTYSGSSLSTDTIRELLSRHITGLSFSDLHRLVNENEVIPDHILPEVREFCKANTIATHVSKSVELVFWLMSDGSWQIDHFPGQYSGESLLMERSTYKETTGIRTHRNCLERLDSELTPLDLANNFPFINMRRAYNDDFVEISPPVA